MRSAAPSIPSPDRGRRPQLRAGDLEEFFGRQPTHTCDLDNPEPLIRNLALAVVETMLGQRNPAQLAPWPDATVLEKLTRFHTAVARRNLHVYGRTPHTPVSLGTIRIDQSVDGITECSIVIHTSRRPRALAMKLEGYDGRWLVTILRLL